MLYLSLTTSKQLTLQSLQNNYC